MIYQIFTSYTLAFKHYKWYVLFYTQLILLSFILVFAVLRIRSTIKNTLFAHPKDKLVVVHVSNFILNTTIFFIVEIYINYRLDHATDQR